MNIIVLTDALLLIMSLTLIFFPQLHLNFIFTICLIIEKFGCLCYKIFEFAFYYGLALVLLLMASYVFLVGFVLLYKKLTNLYFMYVCYSLGIC